MEKRLVAEVSFEVCWQLGGIYTVLRSKAPEATAHYGDRYCLVGPYNEATAETEFEEMEPAGPFGRACARARQLGVEARFGRWLVTGKPKVVLLDFRKLAHRLAELKYYLWKDHYIETPDDAEINDIVLFGYAVAEYLTALGDVVREAAEARAPSDDVPPGLELPILAHFHEWMAGMAIPEIRKRQLPVATVFTTHATLLGRYLASDDPNFYSNLPHIDPVAAAHSRGIYARHAIERSAAWSADVFTTVSDITGYEAEHFLGRRPDILVPNGLSIQRFAALHEFQNLHARYKKKIHEFVVGHFFPSYTFDLDRTLYVVISGRYEYRNKGLDVFIEALARLNARLKSTRRNLTVIAFIVTRAPNRGVNVDVLKSQVLLRDLYNTVGGICERMKQKLVLQAAEGRMPELEDVIDENDQIQIKRRTIAWKRRGWPAIATHDMIYDADDAVLRQLRASQLFSSPEDPVKVVFHPEFLTSTSPLIGLDYSDFVRGCHLGVFPSYYEPWGYTPMECAALGVPAVTSDLAGFGTYVMSQMPDHDQRGLFVNERRYRTFGESAAELAELMEHVLTQERRERIDLRNRVEATSARFDWKVLVKSYWDAHSLAVARAAKR